MGGGFPDRLLASLRELITREAPWVKRASVYGSALREEDTEDLDLALFVSKKDVDRTE